MMGKSLFVLIDTYSLGTFRTEQNRRLRKDQECVQICIDFFAGQVPKSKIWNFMDKWMFVFQNSKEQKNIFILWQLMLLICYLCFLLLQLALSTMKPKSRLGYFYNELLPVSIRISQIWLPLFNVRLSTSKCSNCFPAILLSKLQVL